MAKQPKTYRVMDTVTRAEYHDIYARNERDAEELAFEDGMLLKEGDATNVDCWGITRSLRRSPKRTEVIDLHQFTRSADDAATGQFIIAPNPAGIHPEISIRPNHRIRRASLLDERALRGFDH
jgi:hypothetical protein